MKILLLNDNPVVNKLVTLSAQKTSDDLEVISSIDDISSQSCDLLVLDDTLYTDEGWEEIQEKVKFKKSLYICAKNAIEVSGFTATLKKPFLPTELVELFSTLSKGLSPTDLSETQEAAKTKSLHQLNDLEEDEISLDDELESLDYLDNLDDLRDDELINLEHLGELEDLEGDETSLDDELNDLEEETTQKHEKETLAKEDENPAILDKDELQEVQELLDEAEDLELEEMSGSDTSEYDTDLEDFDLEEKLPQSLPLDSELEELLGELEDDDKEIKGMEDLDAFADLSDELELEESEISAPSKNDEVAHIDELDDFDELELEEMEISTSSKNDEVADFDELDELELEETEIGTPSKNNEVADIDELAEVDLEEDSFEDELELEDQIQDAVEKLSDEDLESELDEDTLLDMVGNDIGGLDSLTSRDLKLAMGEEIEEPLEELNFEEIETSSSHKNEIAEVEEADIKESSTDENEGVESLKKLLAALSSHDVAASLKGMKISINITLGEK
ncbi:MAG: DNA topoisomerase IV [Sulfurimonas sp.]